MMIDTDLQLALTQSIAAAAGTALVGSQVDTAVAGTLDGTNIGLIIVVTTAIITGGSAGKIRFQLASGTTAAIPVDGSAVVLFQTQDFVTGATPIPVGSVLFAAHLPRQSGVYVPANRFIGLTAVISTTTITAGAVSAFLLEDVGRYTSLPVAAN